MNEAKQNYAAVAESEFDLRREVVRLRNINKDLLEACEARIDEWHADSRNFTRNEPPSLALTRAAIRKAKAEGK